MKYLIASYNRPNKQCTARYLNSVGVPKDDIIIGVQTESDLDSYTRSVGDIATVVYKPAHNAAGNRNNIISLLDDGEQFMLADDDIRSLAIYRIEEIGRYGKRYTVDEDCFNSIVEYVTCLLDNGVFAVGTQKNDNMITLYNICYDEDKKESIKLSPEYLLSGECIFMRKGELTTFNDELDCIDDLYLSMKLIAEGKTIVCINQLTTNKPQDTTNTGGCFDVYQSGGKLKAFLTIFREFHPMCIPTRGYRSYMLRKGIRGKVLS